MNSNEAFDAWKARVETPLPVFFESAMRAVWNDAVAWKEQQDLACVEAVRTGFTGLDVSCERIAAQIKGEGRQPR